jgi:pimeloyl-ACP methyl ester carboxylesterase
MKTPDRQYFFGEKNEKLRILEWGQKEQPAILMVHGFPGCAEHAGLLTTSHLQDKFRLISFDRPGYGTSDFQKKLTPLKLAAQLQNLIDSLQIDRVSLLSVSGGAPFSMALAFLLKDRVQKITSVAGIAPLTLQNFRYMNSQQKKVWMLRNLIPTPVLRYSMNQIWKSGLDRMDQFLFSNLENITRADRDVFQHPIIGKALAESVKISLAQGPAGILHDLKTYSRPWGFAISEIKCPITLWHGSDDDVVHFKFTEEMNKRLPQAKLKLMPGEGHYSLAMNCRDEILQDLLFHT